MARPNAPTERDIAEAAQRVEAARAELEDAEAAQLDVWWLSYHTGASADFISQHSGKSARTIWRKLHDRMLAEGVEDVG